jgi:hypothetical protein
MTTVVSCQAFDHAVPANASELQTFRVTVLGAGDQLNALIDQLNNKQMEHHLDKVLKALDSDDAKAYCKELDKVFNEAQRQSGKKLSASDAAQIEEAVANIETVLQCSSEVHGPAR